jgi:putative addiction module killer protein
MNRVRLGNMGDTESVGEGVFELRIHFGPGYRVYFGELDQVIVILLCGGTKRTQRRDIERAKVYWRNLRSHGDE